MIHAVIGAQFGDEGKGLMVDYLSQHQTLVVRFNGGAQAGHTVVRADGHRHEFQHFGAGGYRGAFTLLSRFFIVNPILYVQELGDIKGIPYLATYVDERCLVTTPVDMMLNTLVEKARGSGRHGSCGVGINETVTRCEQEASRLTVGQLATESLRSITNRVYTYGLRRAEKLGVELPDGMTMLEIFDRWAYDVKTFMRSAQIVNDVELIERHTNVVFEGAQGLRLDELAPGGFPHVTRSRTGMTNVITLLNESKRTDVVDVVYVTRAYVTRHGAGPLGGETDGHPYGWTGPESNVENESQGKLRYAKLEDHAMELRNAIKRDITNLSLSAPSNNIYRIGLAVTCNDQVPASDAASSFASWAAQLPLWYKSFGPTRFDVEKCSNVAQAR